MPFKPVRVFLSYSHKDKDIFDQFCSHVAVLRHENIIDLWSDKEIHPGDEWNKEILNALEEARIILLIVSENFLSSKFCYCEEMRRAVARHDAGTATVIPIIVGHCYWEPAPFGKLQALPQGAVPVLSVLGQERNKVYRDIAEAIHRTVTRVAEKATTEPPSPAVGIPVSPATEPSAGTGATVTATSESPQRPPEEAVRKAPQDPLSAQKDLVREALSDPKASIFVEHLKENLIKTKIIPSESDCLLHFSIFNAMRDFSSEKLIDLFMSTREAVLSVKKEIDQDNAIHTATERAAVALYILASCYLINRKIKKTKGYLVSVRLTEPLVCAVIATALFGGEVTLRQEDGKGPSAEYVFRIQNHGIWDEHGKDAFEIAVYSVIKPNLSELPELTLESGGLTEKKKEEIRSRLRLYFKEIKYNRRSCPWTWCNSAITV